MRVLEISVVIPVRNEEKYIEACLESLLDQTCPMESYELIVVDGRSSDRSREIVEEIAQRFGNVRYLENPEGIVPVAMNIGIRHAAGKIIVRADGHNTYPRDYLANCVKWLDRTGADNVGGPCRTVACDESFAAGLVAAILSNPFGVGDSRFRTTNAQGLVDTVPFGAFRREIFERVGMFNEKLVRNQDNELNARIRASGGKIYQASELATQYHPVASFRQLLVQTFRTSQWHAFTIRENSRSMELRHLVPAAFVVTLVVLLLGGLFSREFLLALGVVMGLYLWVGLVFSFRRRPNRGLGIALALPFACFCFHAVYGVATILGLRYLFKAPSAHPIREGAPISETH